MKITHIKSALATALLFIVVLSLTFLYPSKTWRAEGKDWIYQNEGTQNFPAIVTTNGRKYFVDSSLKKKDGFQTLDGNTFYFNQWQGMQTNWVEVDNHWYFLQSDTGKMSKGFTEINHHWYYFFDDGKLLEQSQEIDGQWLEISKDGTIINQEVAVKEAQNG